MLPDDVLFEEEVQREFDFRFTAAVLDAAADVLGTVSWVSKEQIEDIKREGNK